MKSRLEIEAMVRLVDVKYWLTIPFQWGLEAVVRNPVLRKHRATGAWKNDC